MKISLGIYPNERPADIIASAMLADRMGYSTVWVLDSHLLFHEVYTLAELSGGRALLGISVGDSALKSINLAPANMSVLAETVALCRRLLAGETVSFAEGQTAQLHHVGAGVPIYIAATGPKMLELAGRIADGVILMNGIAPELIREAVGIVRQGERTAGRQKGCVKIAVWAACHPSRDAVKFNVARTILRNIPGESDDRTRRVAESVKQAYDFRQHGRADADFARLIPDDIVTRFAFSGGYAEIARQVKALEPCDVNEVVLAIPVAAMITPRDVVMRELGPMIVMDPGHS